MKLKRFQSFNLRYPLFYWRVCEGDGTKTWQLGSPYLLFFYYSTNITRKADWAIRFLYLFSFGRGGRKDQYYVQFQLPWMDGHIRVIFGG